MRRSWEDRCTGRFGDVKGAIDVGLCRFWPLVIVAVVVAVFVAAASSASATGTRPRLVAFSLKTGAPLTALPQVARNGTVYAVADDGRSGWYVGGSFTSIGGIGCANLAHIGPDRRVDRGWCPRPTSIVRALVRAGSRLYVAGEHYGGDPPTRIAGQRRANLAAFDTRSGRLLPWNPGVVSRNEHNGYAAVYDLALSPDGRWLYVSGIFNRLGGAVRHNFGSVDVRSGRASSFTPDPIENAHEDCVSAFAATRTRVYVTGAYTQIGGVGRTSFQWVALDAHTGRLLTRAPKIEGDLVDAVVVGDTVYVGGSFTRLGGAARVNLAAFDGATGTATRWSPAVDAKFYPYALAVSGRQLFAALAPDDSNDGRRQLAAYDLDSAELAWQRKLPSADWTILASSETAIVLGA